MKFLGDPPYIISINPPYGITIDPPYPYNK